MELTDLKETAELARLNLGEQELRETFPAFEQMLSFFAILQDGDNALPATGEQAGPTKTVDSGWLRPDAVPASEEGRIESMLSQSADRDGRFIVIPNVL